MIETDHLSIPKGARKLPDQLYFCEVCGETTNGYPYIRDANGKHYLCNRCVENWKEEYARKTAPYFQKMYDDMMALNE